MNQKHDKVITGKSLLDWTYYLQITSFVLPFRANFLGVQLLARLNDRAEFAFDCICLRSFLAPIGRVVQLIGRFGA